MKTGIAQVEDEEHMVKTSLYEEVRREFAELEFDRNVEEIVHDNIVSPVARFLTRCEAIRARNISVWLEIHVMQKSQITRFRVGQISR